MSPLGSIHAVWAWLWNIQFDFNMYYVWFLLFLVWILCAPVWLLCASLVDPFFASEGSGSGESDTDLFLPSFHYHYGKNLNPACIFVFQCLFFPHSHYSLLYQTGSYEKIRNISLTLNLKCLLILSKFPLGWEKEFYLFYYFLTTWIAPAFAFQRHSMLHYLSFGPWQSFSTELLLTNANSLLTVLFVFLSFVDLLCNWGHPLHKLHSVSPRLKVVKFKSWP